MQFGILGPLEVTAAAGPIPVTGARTRALLAMLIVDANRVLPVERITDRLWPELTAERAAANLQVRLSGLRRAFREAGEDGRLRTRPPGYLLIADADEVDATRFAALTVRGRVLLQQGDPAAARTALDEGLGLWRGSALADVGDQLWAQREADRLTEGRLAALELHVDARLACGPDDQLAGELRALTGEHPLRERLWAQRMLALYLVGRQAEALACYGQLRSHLIDELGIEPGTELRELQARILAQDPALSAAGLIGQPTQVTLADPLAHQPAESAGPTVPRQLPARVRHFAGRATEVKVLDELLDDGQGPDGTVPIVTIVGPGGVGKTALAVHWAHQVAGHFPDGQLYIDLHGFDPAAEPIAAAEAVHRFLDGFAVPPERLPASPQAQVGLYRSLAADKRLLIVLDNARDAAQVRPLLPASPGSLVVVTSRLAMRGLVASHGARSVKLDVLAADEAVQLLSSRLGPERLGTDPAAVAELTQLCSGLPLALAIVAAHATAQPELPLTVLAGQLAAEPERLDAFETGDEATSVRSILSWSTRHLSTAAARLFRLLAIHPGPDISGAAAASLAGLAPRDANRLLAELIAASLLAETLPGRHALHDLVRAYAAEQAREVETDSDRRAATRRMLDHYLHTAATAVTLTTGDELWFGLRTAATGVTAEPLATKAQALAWYEAERQILVSLTSLAADAGLDEHGWQLPQTMRTYLFRAGHWQDWAVIGRLGLACAERLGEHTALGYAQLAMANFYFRSGGHVEAIALASEGLDHFAAAGDRDGEASAQAVLAASLMRADRDLEALGHAEKAAALYAKTGHRESEAYALATVGELRARLGDARASIDYCRQALERSRELGDAGLVAAALASLGRALLLAGESAPAITSFQQSIEHWPADRGYGQAESYFGIGDAYEATGDRSAARGAWQQGLDLIGNMYHPDADRVRDRLAQLAF